MRAELTEKGMMYIMAETPVEGYALSRWSENQVHNENVTLVWDKKWFRVDTFDENQLIDYGSDYRLTEADKERGMFNANKKV